MSELLKEAGPAYKKAVVAAVAIGGAVGAGVFAFAAWRRSKGKPASGPTSPGSGTAPEVKAATATSQDASSVAGESFQCAVSDNDVDSSTSDESKQAERVFRVETPPFNGFERLSMSQIQGPGTDESFMQVRHSPQPESFEQLSLSQVGPSSSSTHSPPALTSTATTTPPLPADWAGASICSSDVGPGSDTQKTSSSDDNNGDDIVVISEKFEESDGGSEDGASLKRSVAPTVPPASPLVPAVIQSSPSPTSPIVPQPSPTVPTVSKPSPTQPTVPQGSPTVPSPSLPTHTTPRPYDPSHESPVFAGRPYQQVAADTSEFDSSKSHPSSFGFQIQPTPK